MRVEVSGVTVSNSYFSVSGIAGDNSPRFSGCLQDTLGISQRHLDNENKVSEAHVIKKTSLHTSPASILPEPFTLSCLYV